MTGSKTRGHHYTCFTLNQTDNQNYLVPHLKNIWCATDLHPPDHRTRMQSREPQRILGSPPLGLRGCCWTGRRERHLRQRTRPVRHPRLRTQRGERRSLRQRPLHGLVLVLDLVCWVGPGQLAWSLASSGPLRSPDIRLKWFISLLKISKL